MFSGIDLSVTLLAASVLGLVFVWLCWRVIATRVAKQALIGDGGDTELQFRMRAHANFTEYVPIFLIVLGLVELSGGNQTALALIAGVFVLARLLHVPGMGPSANLKLRQAGIVGSFLGIIAVCLYGLYLAIV